MTTRTGHHVAAWRHSDSQADGGIDFRHYMRLAQAAEAAKFDLVFLADGVGTRGDDVEFLSRTAPSYVAQFEPLTLLSALAAVTERRLFRSDYAGRTPRDHLGLRRPARHAFAVSSAPATSAGSTAAFA